MKNGFEGEMLDGYRTKNGWKNSCINDYPNDCVRLPYNWSSTSTAYIEGAYID